MNPKAWVEAIVELIWRVGLRFAIWVGMFYFLYRVRSVIVVIVLAAVVTYAVLPAIEYLCKKRIRGVSRRIQRFGVTSVVFILLLSATGLAVYELARPFWKEMDELVRNASVYAENLKILAKQFQAWYGSLDPGAQKFLQGLNFQGIVDWLTLRVSTIGQVTIGTVGRLVELVLIPVLAFYFALDPRSLKREFVAIVPKRHVKEALALAHEMNAIMRSYVVGQLILCVIAGVFVAILLHVMHMPYILVLSVFAGITRAVPVIGPIVSGAAIVLIGTARDPILGLDLLILFAVLQFVESKFIMPKLIGDRMQVHPAIIIIALLVGAEFFGAFGMFMAAPVAALVRVLVRYYFIKPKQLHVWGLTPHGHHELSAPELTPIKAEIAVVAEEDI